MTMFLILVLSSLVWWSYNACLVSILAVEIFTLPIHSLNVMVDKSQYRLLIKNGTAATD
jgi:hypothetical protein